MAKKCFSCLDFCLDSSPDIKKIWNQEGFSRQIKMIVLFLEKNKSKLSFLLLLLFFVFLYFLETSKIICQWGKQNNLVFCLRYLGWKQDKIWEATQHLITGFRKIIPVLRSVFSAFHHCINYWWTQSFLFELSLSGLFNHVFRRHLSFKHIKMHKFTLFLIYM